MTVLAQNRQALDQQLDDPTTTILLVSGPRGSSANEVHDAAEESIGDPWRFTFLITQLSVLDAAEKKAWFKSDGCYAVLGGDVPKTVVETGAIEELCKADGTPSIRAIRSAFARGDQA